MVIPTSGAQITALETLALYKRNISAFYKSRSTGFRQMSNASAQTVYREAWTQTQVVGLFVWK